MPRPRTRKTERTFTWRDAPFRPALQDLPCPSCSKSPGNHTSSRMTWTIALNKAYGTRNRRRKYFPSMEFGSPQPPGFSALSNMRCQGALALSSGWRERRLLFSPRFLGSDSALTTSVESESDEDADDDMQSDKDVDDDMLRTICKSNSVYIVISLLRKKSNITRHQIQSGEGLARRWHLLLEDPRWPRSDSLEANRQYAREHPRECRHRWP